jgi:hypothetical protein
MEQTNPKGWDALDARSGVYQFTVGEVMSTGFLEQVSDFYTSQTHQTEATVLYDHRVEEMQKRIEEMQKRIEEFSEELINISNKIDTLLKEEINLRDIPYETAKEEIRKYFQKNHGKDIDAADLQEALGIEIAMAMEICEELEEEGKIASK